MSPAGWSKEDEIRWVENRVWDQKKERRYSRSIPEAQDLEIWLAKERDRLSWNQIALKYFPESYKPSARENWSAVNKARRAYERVQRYLNPTQQEALQKMVDEHKQRIRIGDLPVEVLYNCSPDYFEEHVLRRRQSKRHRPKGQSQKLKPPD